jgi:endo-1,4-beta-xylanase
MRTIALLGLLFLSPIAWAQKNLVTNGDFEDGLFGWNVYGASTTPWMFKTGKNACVITTENNDKWVGMDQAIDLPKNTAALHLQVWVRTDNVQIGDAGWKKAQVNIEVLDKNEQKMDGGFSLASLEGTGDWQLFERKIKLETGARRIKISVAMGYAMGAMFVDGLSVKVIKPEDMPAAITNTQAAKQPDISAKLVNGDFEKGLDGWPDYAGVITSDAHTGEAALMVENKNADEWPMRRQVIAVPAGMSELRISGWIKTTDVGKFPENWRNAMMYCLFLDGNGKPLSDDLQMIYQTRTAHDWRLVQNTLQLPLQTRAVQLHIGLGKTTGQIFADDLQLEFREATKKKRQAATAIEQVSLKQVAPFRMGVEAANNIMTDFEEVNKVVVENFNAYTVGTLKMDAIQRQQGAFKYERPDAELGFAETNKMRAHGHTLIYWISSPDWFRYPDSKEKLEAEAKQYIQSVLKKYKGRFGSVDVANEFFGYNNGAISTDSINNIAASWRKLYKTDDEFWHFLGRCFQWAREADPSVKLFYNDYAQQEYPAKRDSIISLALKLKKWGYPIDGLGIQMHTNIWQQAKGIDEAMVRLAKTGLLIHVSEMDISINHVGNALVNPPYTNKEKWMQYDVAQTIGRSFLKNVPAAQQWGITLWDVGDRDSWLPKYFNIEDSACLWDWSYERKLCYYGLMSGVSSKTYLPEWPCRLLNADRALSGELLITAKENATSFQFVYLSNGYYRLSPVTDTKKAAGLFNNRCVLGVWDGDDAQQWRLESKSNGYFSLANKVNGQPLVVEGVNEWRLSFDF